MFTAYKAILITNPNMPAIRTEMGEDLFHQLSEDLGHFLHRTTATYVVFGTRESFMDQTDTVTYVPAGVIYDKFEIANQSETVIWITLKKE
jgi:hypothetical protein